MNEQSYSTRDTVRESDKRPRTLQTEKEVQLHLTRTRHGLSNEPSTKVERCS